MTYDGALWGALACVLSALIAVLSWQRAKTSGIRAGVRGAAWALLPIAAWLTGTLRLLTEILGDIGNWAGRVVFSPGVWLGIILAGIAVILFGVSGRLPSRNKGKGPRAAAPGQTRKKKAVTATGDKDMDDIEAILRKHGIS